MSLYSRDGGGSRGEYARALEMALLRHEVGQPIVFLSASLALVRSELEQVAKTGGPIGPALAKVQAAEEGARHALDVVYRIGVEHGAPRELVNITEVVTSTLRIVEDSVTRHAVLTTDLRPVPSVRANRTELRQILLNLLSNAMASVESARGSSNRISIRVGQRAPSAVALVIEDDGGNSLIARDRIGYSRIASFGRSAGLGLAFCKRVVASWGGVFAVESEPGLRTVASVVLPVAEAVSDAASGP